MINQNFVTYIGPVKNKNIWDYQYFADVGIALAQGREQHNESSEIYYYLRTGLPVVSGTPILNNNIIKEANLGSIADYGNDRSVQLQHRATSFTKTKIAKLLIILIKASLWRRITNSYIDLPPKKWTQ